MRNSLSAAILSVLALGAPGAASVAQVPAAYTVEPFATPATITIQGTGVRLRAEPFATPQTQVLSSGSTGLALTVVGLARQPDWNWYQVVLSNGQKAFIRSDLTSAPSRGGQGAATALPPIPVIGATPAPVTPQPIAPSPVATPPPYGSTAYNRPVTPQPAYTPPVQTPPVQTQTPQGQPAGPGNAPISLVPRSTLPALQPGSPADPSGLQSVPPGQ